MNLLDHVLPFKKFSLHTLIGFLGAYLVSQLTLDRAQGQGLIAGYIFCWANITALAYLGGLLVGSLASQGEMKISKHLKGFAMFLGVMKFFFFMIALFVLVSILKLEPLFLFIGAFSALVVMASSMSYFYLQYVKEEARKNLAKQEEIRLLRLASQG